jgi:hypothetical protein
LDYGGESNGDGKKPKEGRRGMRLWLSKCYQAGLRERRVEIEGMGVLFCWVYEMREMKGGLLKGCGCEVIERNSSSWLEKDVACD